MFVHPGFEARFSEPRFCRDSSLSTRVIRLRTSFGTSKGRCCALDGQPLLVSVPVDKMSNGEVNQEAIDDFVVVSMLLSRRRAVFLSFAAPTRRALRSNVTTAAPADRGHLRAHLTFLHSSPLCDRLLDTRRRTQVISVRASRST